MKWWKRFCDIITPWIVAGCFLVICGVMIQIELERRSHRFQFVVTNSIIARGDTVSGELSVLDPATRTWKTFK